MIPRAPYSYRSDPSVPAFPDDRPIIVFDGVCVFCSAWAKFVLRHDTAARYRLLTAQTALGRALFVHYGLDPDDYETNLLIEDGRAWAKSTGTLRMLEGLGRPWSWLAVLGVIPERWRDRAYDLVARNRYRLFGRGDTCLVPTPEVRSRFLTW